MVAAAVAELPDRQRIVLTLRDVHGYDAAEVGAILEVSPGNQRVLLHRARATSGPAGGLRYHTRTRAVTVMDCDEFVEQVTAYLDGALSPERSGGCSTTSGVRRLRGTRPDPGDHRRDRRPDREPHGGRTAGRRVAATLLPESGRPARGVRHGRAPADSTCTPGAGRRERCTEAVACTTAAR